MSQSFFLAANSPARRPLHQLEGTVAAPDMVADPMQGHHLPPDDMAVVAIQNDMTSIDPSPRPDHDLQFALGHIHLNLGHRHHAEVVPTRTPGITGAEARVTAATVTAVEVAVQTATEAVIDIKHQLFCSPIT
ncbi:ATPase AAA-type core [Penicillium bovifimosum]|uniref:ATPase AAA-type core n=1 Tax=Penicillium bovifimosum TaxID=126998 RepID=A0A9W9HAG5_9EURO|nr:ATPase AAA-type core [Penicillium bovifimosum]KAJ5143081.1 ATPase AAA-type core [Penicillium bovifimosum]